MKKILVIAFVLVMGSAYANQMNTGCGLGTMLLGDKANTKVMQSLVTTTNVATSSQFTGITLDIESFKCRPTAKWAYSEEVNSFVLGNMDNIAKDVAAGSGETINALASMLNIEDTETFGNRLKKNFDIIFPNEDVDSAYVSNTIYLLSEVNA